MLIMWPILWIVAMVVLTIATIIAGVREKKARAKAAPQGMQPMPVTQDEVTPLDGGDGFGDSFGNDASFGDDPFK